VTEVVGNFFDWLNCRDGLEKGLKKGLAKLRGMNTIAKKADAVRGQETKWEIQFITAFAKKVWKLVTRK
jgi:hypothetical protein